MNYNDFTLWLYGYLFDKDRDLTLEETKIIEEKLNSCFNKVTPYINTAIPSFDFHRYHVTGFDELNALNKQPITC